MCNSCLFVLQFCFSVLFNLNVKFAYIWISSINWLQMKSQTIVYLPCMYVHTLFYTSELYCEAIFINNWSATSPGLNASLASKFWHKWERLYWIIQRWRPFVIHILCMSFFLFPIFFLLTYWWCKNSFILFLSSNFF